MGKIQTLLDRQSPTSTPVLPAELGKLYGGDLCFPAKDQTYVIANFASTLDGVVSYEIPGKSSGGEITGHNADDRFIMALLRGSADAVMVGSRTFDESGPSNLWTPESLYPEAAPLLKAYSGARSERPLIVIVSGNGRIDISRSVFHTPNVKTLILTTPKGKQRIDALCAGARCSLETKALGADDMISPEAMIKLLSHEFGVRLLLHEGGPMLFGQFVKANLIDELFLTVAPQLAGRDSTADRVALIRTAMFLPGESPRLNLLSVKNSGDHLFLRYKLTRR